MGVGPGLGLTTVQHDNNSDIRHLRGVLGLRQCPYTFRKRAKELKLPRKPMIAPPKISITLWVSER